MPQRGWYRYSAGGELLASQGYDPARGWGDSPQGWVNFYWPEAQAVTADTESGLRHRQGPARRSGSYWVRLAPLPAGADSYDAHAQREVVAAYAWDGTPLELDAPIPPARLASRVLMRQDIPGLYAAQQEYGAWFGQAAAAAEGAP